MILTPVKFILSAMLWPMPQLQFLAEMGNTFILQLPQIQGHSKLGLICPAKSDPIAQLFTNDAAVAELTAFLFVFAALTQPLNALVFGIDGILIGAGDLRFLAWAMMGSFAAYAGIALSTANLGMGWLWACLVGLMVFRGGAVWARFKQEGWIRVGAN